MQEGAGSDGNEGHRALFLPSFRGQGLLAGSMGRCSRLRVSGPTKSTAHHARKCPARRRPLSGCHDLRCNLFYRRKFLASECSHLEFFKPTLVRFSVSPESQRQATMGQLEPLLGSVLFSLNISFDALRENRSDMWTNPHVEDSGCILAPTDLMALSSGFELMFTEKPPLA